METSNFFTLVWFLKILKLPYFTKSISKFSKMQLGNLSQIILPNMWLLVLFDTNWLWLKIISHRRILDFIICHLLLKFCCFITEYCYQMILKITIFKKKKKKKCLEKLPFYIHVYHKWRSYDVWFRRYGAKQTEFFVILDHFFPFYPHMDLENQNF